MVRLRALPLFLASAGTSIRSPGSRGRTTPGTLGVDVPIGRGECAGPSKSCQLKFQPLGPGLVASSLELNIEENGSKNENCSSKTVNSEGTV